MIQIISKSELPKVEAIIRLVSETGLGWAGAGLKKQYMEQVSQFDTIVDNDKKGFQLGDVLIWRKANRPVAFICVVRKNIREQVRVVSLLTVLRAVKERCESEGIQSIELPFENGVQESAENLFTDYNGTLYLVN